MMRTFVATSVPLLLAFVFAAPTVAQSGIAEGLQSHLLTSTNLPLGWKPAPASHHVIGTGTWAHGFALPDKGTRIVSVTLER